MANAAKPSANRRPRRRGTRAQTRERLIQAALELLHSGGESAVTTVSVTRAAGTVQSMFYQHFANVEECLAAAAEQVTGQIREVVAAHRQRMYDTGPGAGEDLIQGYRDMFRLVARQRPLMQLFLRHHFDPLALNGVMYRFARGLSSDLAKQLMAQATKAGLSAPPRKWIEALADNLVGASLTAIAAHLERRGPSVEHSAQLLAAFSEGAVLGVYGALQSKR